MKTLRFAIALLTLSLTPAMAQVTLKLATLAPDGSIWMQAINDAKDEIEVATGGAVKLKIYPGGIMGSEKDVLFKIRTGQLQGGGFMGYAIGIICPDAAAVMFPMVFRNYEEVDQTFAKFQSYLDEHVRKNGYEALGWTEVGFSYAYSTKPIASLEALRATKVWGLDSPMLLELFKAGQISSIPANVTDVLPALQTGALETVFGPPTAHRCPVANQSPLLQHHATGYSIGGIFVSQSAWKKVPAQHQDVVKAIFQKYCAQLNPKVRKSDLDALAFLQSQGVTAVDATPETRAQFEQLATTVREKVTGSVFSAEAWNQLEKFLQESRNP